MKNFIKNWWWLIIITVFIVIVVSVRYYEEKESKQVFKNIGESSANFYNELNESNGYSEYFTYNEKTGKVEYHPPITLERYNRIKEGMTEEQVVAILGNGEKLQPEESNGFLMTWGDLNLSKSPYYRIQIIFNSSGQVETKGQMGLK